MDNSVWITSKRVRSVSMTKVTRRLGRKPTLRLAPSWVATTRSGSERSGNPSDSLSSNWRCFSTGSALMPTRCAPTAANSAARSRKWQLSLVQPYVMAAG